MPKEYVFNAYYYHYKGPIKNSQLSACMSRTRNYVVLFQHSYPITLFLEAIDVLDKKVYHSYR
ncbi:MAG: hypothetical protein PHQ34_03405 [Methanothrix sp.]|nr:hypothetical protein [Methanothrix sp.]